MKSVSQHGSYSIVSENLSIGRFFALVSTLHQDWAARYQLLAYLIEKIGVKLPVISDEFFIFKFFNII